MAGDPFGMDHFEAGGRLDIHAASQAGAHGPWAWAMELVGGAKIVCACRDAFGGLLPRIASRQA